MQQWIRKGRKQLCMIMTVLLLASSLIGSFPVQAYTSNNNVVISQVYGGGGNSGALYTNDFIELYNPTGADISLAGWSVQYASSTGTTWSSTPLTGIIAAERYYLVQEAAGTNTIAALPTVDATGTLALSGTKGKVRLVNAASVVVDLVGYGSSTPATTGGEGTPTGDLSNSTAAIRKPIVIGTDGRGLDTDVNSSDFVVGKPDPRNSSYIPVTKVADVQATPGSGAVAPGTSVALSTATVGASVYYKLNTTVGAAVYYSAPITITEPTTITAYAQRAGLDDSATATFNYTIKDANTVTIAAARNKAANETATVEGIVTYREDSGGYANLYIQDSTGGIVVRSSTANLSAVVGDKISAFGPITIYNGLVQIEKDKSDFSGGSLTVLQSNLTLPNPVLLTSADFLPGEGNAKGPGGQYEGMLITLKNVSITSSNSSTFYGTDNLGNKITIYAKNAAAALSVGKDYEQLYGVMTYNTSYGLELLPRSAADIVQRFLSVSSSVPSGGIAKGGSVTLSTLASGGTIYYTTDGTIPTASSTPYSSAIVVNANTTIKAIVVTPQATSDIYTFTYEVLKELDKLRIHDIQGAAHSSLYVGSTVQNVYGIVTYVVSTSNFYMQELPNQVDSDDRTSEAILVNKATTLSPGLKAGDLITVTGTVNEYTTDAALLTVTRIAASSINTISSNNALPEAVLIGNGGRIVPKVIDTDNLTVFNPNEDAIDFYESLEGMRVTIKNPVITGPYSSTPGLAVTFDNSPNNPMRTPAGGIILRSDIAGQPFESSLNPQKLFINRKPSVAVKTGDSFEQPITGILIYDEGNFKLNPEAALPAVKDGGLKQATTSINKQDGKLTIATFNVENFNESQKDKAAKIGKIVVENLKTPDILGLMEVQDNNGELDDGNTDAKGSFNTLIEAIKANNGPTYAFKDIAPENNKDGGAPGGNIRLGFLYNTDRVTLKPGKSEGKYNTAVTVESDGSLSMNPGRIDPTNEAFTSSRKPLAAEFVFQGERIVVVANHFNSKGGDLKPFGSTQPVTRVSEVQRAKQATVVNNFVKSLLGKDPNANVVLLGDFNDFQFSRTLSIVKDKELTNLVDLLDENKRYSYVYDGNSQTLDNILTDNQLAKFAAIEAVHVNSDFEAADGRVSDHDPLLTQLDLAAKKASQSQGNIKVQILGVNDLHGNIDSKFNEKDSGINRDLDGDGKKDKDLGGMQFLATHIKAKRDTNPNTLVVHSGDMVGASPPLSALFYDEPTIKVLNEIGFDVGAVGNHEFDDGTNELIRLAKGGVNPSGKDYEGMEFPILGANVRYKADNKHVFDPYVVKEIGGAKIGFIGVVTEETPSIVIPTGIQDLKFTSAVDEVNAAVKELKAQGVRAIVVLAHMSADMNDKGQLVGEAVNLANGVDDEVDAIFAAHNHKEVKGTVKNKLIVSAWEYSKALMDVDLEISRETGDVVSKSAEILYNLRTVDADAKVQGIIDEYKALAGPKLQEVVGQNLNEMTKDYPGKGIGKNSDFALGNMIADAMKAEMKADFAMMNGGGVRDNLNVGEITWEELFKIQPFNNTLVKVEVTGAEMKAIVEAQLGTGSTFGPDSHVGGFRYTWAQIGSTRKVIDITLPDGTPLDPGKTYSLVVNSFMYTSNDARYIQMHTNGKNPVQGPEDLPATVNFVKNHVGPINYVAEGRIREIAAPDAIAPTWPGNKSLTASGITTSSVTLVWSQATDNVAVTGYKVFNGSSLVTTVTGSTYTYTVSGLPPRTNYVFKVEAIDAAGNTTTDGPSLEVTTLAQSSSGHSSSPSPGTGNSSPSQEGTGAPASTPNGVVLKPNDADLKKETAADGTAVTKFTVNSESLAQALKLGSGNETTKTVVINMTNVQGTVKVELPSNALKEAAADAKNTIIRIETENKSYNLPLSIINAGALGAALGTSADNVSISITIQAVTGAEAQQINTAAAQPGMKLLSDGVSFTITAEANGKTTEVNDFGTTYVVRTITINEPVNSNEATAVVFDPATKEMTFVPALFEKVDGKTVVKIKRNSNSTYTVVKSEKTFADLKGHWSQKDVELLASKLVVKGQTDSQFAPDSDITRAEFAALLVRALGLKVDASAKSSIKDIKDGEWFVGVLGTAMKASLMEGFEDGTFRPNAKITREQMAVMISRAMAAAGKVGDSKKADVTAKFADGTQIHDWAMDAVAKNTAAGIIQGTSENKFMPAQFATRAEATVMLKRLLEFTEFINK
ncbi:5'-nucleotidase C-terminal domain-containing protein [Paenibacillus radicis (ex Xue et al. 2023)]|uniref:5'-nucleotidase C-terminal domain-containing protein n=1 Tax=Paenibacillus radicis (ex Xue et al. 2023) TaxID=2972489 RepID=A0ABT1YPP9_9BACL|nr:5'-nucleotidase C-terminal domain-containing protein [Paenibacillus radicis (ex Xue et al. 2023)]MCR8635155.1 5'-nucleotidase C-terminal domain-containing protein [Paenibacillus radicis (ex Xue et al. 2023)]